MLILTLGFLTPETWESGETCLHQAPTQEKGVDCAGGPATHRPADLELITDGNRLAWRTSVACGQTPLGTGL